MEVRLMIDLIRHVTGATHLPSHCTKRDLKTSNHAVTCFHWYTCILAVTITHVSEQVTSVRGVRCPHASSVGK